MTATAAIETQHEGAAESPAFLKAVVDLGARQPVTTSQAIFNANGVKLLEGGVRVDPGLYERLVSHRLAQPLDECIDTERSVDGRALREAAAEALQRWPFFARMAPAGRTREIVLEAIASVPLPRPVALHLTLARDTRPDLYAHSVLMALLAVHLVRESGAGFHDIGVAAAAGLLHDMGMLHIDPDLLDSDERLSGDRLKPVYVHPVTSSVLIGRFADYPKRMVRAIVEHHERIDGSGYPRGLVGDAISPLGRVLSLAEVVTAMFDGERAQPEQRVSLLLRIDPRRYDSGLVPSIHRLLRLAPAVVVAGVDAAADADADADADACAPVATSIEGLLRLADLLSGWRLAFEQIGAAGTAAHTALLQSVNGQNETLQRMLYEAGITRDQLAALGDDVADDAAVRVELWALAEELSWQLHAAANQLKRRWQASEPALPYPAPLASWLAEVAALDQSRGDQGLPQP